MKLLDLQNILTPIYGNDQPLPFSSIDNQVGPHISVPPHGSTALKLARAYLLILPLYDHLPCFPLA
jgi:hypothetical protein